MSSGNKRLFLLDNDLANASSVDFCHQLNLVNGFPDLVQLEIFHQLRFEHRNIKRIVIYVPQIVSNIEKLALAKDCLHDLSVSSLNCLLSGGSNDAASLRFSGFVLCCPLSSENTLVFQVTFKKIGVSVVAPAITMLGNKRSQFFILLRGFIKLVLV